MRRLRGHATPASEDGPEAVRIDALAVHAAVEAERRLGSEPRDVRALKCSYDIESRVPETRRLRFIEAKGRHVNGKATTLTKNESLTALNRPDAFLLAIDRVDGDQASAPPNLHRPVGRELDFGVTSVGYSAADLCDGGSAQKEVRASGPISSL